MRQAKPISVEVAPGELFDKITILQIKRQQIDDAEKRKNVQHELDLLRQAQDQAVPSSEELDSLISKLKTINQSLWNIEDDIRECERQQNFGDQFIGLARSVYRTNDQRCAIKREINELLGSEIQEEKSYADYESESS